jgi:hypothetical protein
MIDNYIINKVSIVRASLSGRTPRQIKNDMVFGGANFDFKFVIEIPIKRFNRFLSSSTHDFK